MGQTGECSTQTNKKKRPQLRRPHVRLDLKLVAKTATRLPLPSPKKQITLKKLQVLVGISAQHGGRRHGSARPSSLNAMKICPPPYPIHRCW